MTPFHHGNGLPDKIIQIHLSHVRDLTMYQGEETGVSFELRGPYAETILAQIYGADEPASAPTTAERESTVAAKRDAAEARKRAETAETRAAGYEREIEDYQGEIDALKAELEREKLASKWAVPGGRRGGYWFDPELIWSTPAKITPNKSVGGVVPPASSTKTDTAVIDLAGYTAKDQTWLKELYSKIDEKKMRDMLASSLPNESWHVEYPNTKKARP